MPARRRAANVEQPPAPPPPARKYTLLLPVDPLRCFRIHEPGTLEISRGFGCGCYECAPWIYCPLCLKHGEYNTVYRPEWMKDGPATLCYRCFMDGSTRGPL